MKNYNKILEAVNRGIQLALDDFDDEEQVQNIKSKQIQNRDYTKEYLDLMNYVVDLGLPSGTLWCKYNLGCNYNLLNEHPEQSNSEDWLGDYYAWGEIQTKPTYTWDNYKFGKINQLTKYAFNVKTEYDKSNIDNIDYLLPEDDAAYQNMHLHNFKFYMPTMQQFGELKKYTSVKYKRKYNNIDQLYGALLISKINGNTLFIPAAGYREGSGINKVGSNIRLWSSSLSLVRPDYAHYLDLYSSNIYMSSYSRCSGFSVRPVC